MAFPIKTSKFTSSHSLWVVGDWALSSFKQSIIQFRFYFRWTINHSILVDYQADKSLWLLYGLFKMLVGLPMKYLSILGRHCRRMVSAIYFFIFSSDEIVVRFCLEEQIFSFHSHQVKLKPE